MKPRVFIDGDQGTTGLQIQARLAGRDDLSLTTLPADRRKDPRARADALNGCDIALLCLPDSAAREAVAMVTNPAVRLIDASSAHRIDPRWTYGFPEMAEGQAARIAASRRVTNPGCYPTGAIALLRPLIEAGLLPAGLAASIHAVSGYSGRGRVGVELYEGRAAGAPAFQVYALTLDHKHVPEIQHHARLRERPLFVPAYGAFRQGIVLTIPLHAGHLPAGSSGARMRECLRAFYRDAPRVRVEAGDQGADREGALGGTLDPQALNGTDDLRLAVFENPAHRQVLLAAVFDNLGKGAAGAAVQNLDLMLGG
ncbi:MAG TPA: N-acetyl-gamma-glutamyl-phosphate reductase [Burkholderiaceae bacterium]|nr:N-acetyl-gamma-glutamyl-phosphate reductase [Burkholderiaceae bacterium]